VPENKQKIGLMQGCKSFEGDGGGKTAIDYPTDKKTTNGFYFQFSWSLFYPLEIF
jgi:hypothetical protein